MAYALNCLNNGHVTVPTITGGAGAGRICRFDMEVADISATNPLFGNTITASGTADSVRLMSTTQVQVRAGSQTTAVIAISAGSIPLNTRIVFEVFKTSAPAIEVRVDGVVIGSTSVSTVVLNQAFNVNFLCAVGSTTNRFRGKIYEADIVGTTFLNTNAPNASTWGTGTLVDFPTNGTQWFEYASGGTAPTGTVTIGSITPNSTGASVPFTYSAADQTGFEYRLNGGAAVTGTASPQVLTGLTSSTAYTIEIRAINASGQGAWSTAANFTTSAPAAQVPQGTVTIGTVTTTQTTASVPYTYSLSDQTGFEYRLNGGSAVTATASPQSLTGLTANTAYTIEIRAINATGAGTWSAVKNFTTAAVATGTLTITDLANNIDTPWASAAVDAATVMPLSLGSVVVSKTGLSTTAGADLVITDASIVTGAEYIIILKIGTAYGWYRAVAT